MMRFLSKYFLIIALAACAACETATPAPTRHSGEAARTVAPPPDTKVPEEEAADTITRLRFAECTVTINRLASDIDADKTGIIQGDTVTLFIDLSESIEGQKISVASDLLTDIGLAQRYQTSVTVMDEASRCDLTGWKHYDSEWEILDKDATGNYLAKVYTASDYARFPSTNARELRQYVLKHCGDNLKHLLPSISSPDVYPCSVSISSYFLRISGTMKNTGVPVTKYIVVRVPLGC